MLEKNLESVEQPNKFKDYYNWLLIKFLGGRLGAENAIPAMIDGNKMDLIVFEPSGDFVSFGLFLHDQKYSRKTLLIDKDGQVSEDTVGVLPNFDKTEKEPEFTSSNDQIVTTVIETLKKYFPDN
jgi:hypothetical protein